MTFFGNTLELSPMYCIGVVKKSCYVSENKWIIAELSSGPKGRRAEPHNYLARIEIRKTMRLSFHGRRG